MIIKPFLYLLLALLVLAIVLTWLGAGLSLFVGGERLEFFMTHSNGLNYLFVFQLFLLVSIPVLLLIFSLYGLLRNRARRIKPLKRGLDIIWGINIVLLFGWVIFIINDMAHEHNHVTSRTLDKTNQPLSLKISSPNLNEGPIKFNTPFFKIDNKHFYQRAQLTITASEVDQVIIERKQTARGKDNELAKSRINAMDIPFTLDSTSIQLSNYFEIQQTEQWRGQFLEYELKLPLGQKITIPNIDSYYAKELPLADRSISPEQYQNKTWEMTTQGLQCLDCQSL